MSKLKKEGRNNTVILLTLADMFTWGPFLIISALSGIYLSQKLGVEAIKFVGIGTSIYFFTRSLFQIPMGYLTDKIKGDKDEILLLATGVILMGLPYTLYPNIVTPSHYYILQFIFGIGACLNVTNWRKLFATNIDSGIEGTQYAFYETIISLSTAVISLLVGGLANLGEVYFDVVMVVSGILMMLGCIWVLMIHSVKQRKTNINNLKK
ncbi:MFS transporter [Candidatus Dojkabacteria bacterium]|uniref:MFS transporter n=1 Tax=Candidatus Dojkabacteria bacterium TaxID=2099670 RepID=A0A847CZB6_9BACT|nr:MFS transporter [Candidatus Dojkabacteria bacterium]